MRRRLDFHNALENRFPAGLKNTAVKWRNIPRGKGGNDRKNPAARTAQIHGAAEKAADFAAWRTDLLNKENRSKNRRKEINLPTDLFGIEIARALVYCSRVFFPGRMYAQAERRQKRRMIQDKTDGGRRGRRTKRRTQ